MKKKLLTVCGVMMSASLACLVQPVHAEIEFEVYSPSTLNQLAESRASDHPLILILGARQEPPLGSR